MSRVKIRATSREGWNQYYKYPLPLEVLHKVMKFKNPDYKEEANGPNLKGVSIRKLNIACHFAPLPKCDYMISKPKPLGSLGLLV